MKKKLVILSVFFIIVAILVAIFSIRVGVLRNNKRQKKLFDLSQQHRQNKLTEEANSNKIIQDEKISLDKIIQEDIIRLEQIEANKEKQEETAGE